VQSVSTRGAIHALLGAHQQGCWLVIQGMFWLAVTVDHHRRRLPRRVKRWQKSLRQLYERWLRRRGLVEPPAFRKRHRPWNRTPDDIEQQVVRLHVEQPTLGAGQLRWLAQRVLGFPCARETIRQILIRRRDLVVALEEERRKKPRRIHITEPRKLWGADLTLVWMLGIVPVWLFAMVDYHGSRIVCFERMCWWPTAAQIANALERTVQIHGAPARWLTDRATIFGAAEVAHVLAEHGTRHVRIKPCHVWTNGRVERIFRTFKETVFRHAGLWLFKSHEQVDRFCADFAVFHNGHRAHSSYGGRTPNEVHAGRKPATGCTERIAFFDGRLLWWRFT
jgi:transposase InsO family protein